MRALLLNFISAFQLLSVSAFGATLQWEPVPQPLVAGYKVYVGTFSRAYERVIDVGNVTGWTIDRAPLRVTNFYAVTAYDSFGLESDFSDEVAWARRTANLVVKFDGADDVIEILGTPDFQTFASLGTITPAASGAQFFVARAPTNLSVSAVQKFSISKAGSKRGKL